MYQSGVEMQFICISIILKLQEAKHYSGWHWRLDRVVDVDAGRDTIVVVVVVVVVVNRHHRGRHSLQYLLQHFGKP